MQLQATQKYEPLWTSYKKKYESSENAQRLSSLKRDVATIEKKSNPRGGQFVILLYLDR